ncbi:DegT/DnrJ/EryC1/StrS family aminotransferase [Desulfuromonas acetoxidans]|uniref:DegT/DnrJ/EryC1/StrS family aminotransferase n=1 Tax=Desulfuromonas acetoxidans TaxID=891 RepID=UPI00292E1AD8|nr:DegT/DnrJ/EryC1/StrS family aminotransferase [Desulfuromonas acetoxidans]
MQFIDLTAQQKRIRSQIDEAIKKVLDHGKYIMGPEVCELEKRLAEYVGVEHCVSCSSGTDALLMALMAYGVGPGDAIFTTPFTFVATGEVISLLGATPIFVDIDPQTFNIDPKKLEEAISDFDRPLRPCGIIPVDLFGLPADYDEINALASKYDLFVLEDAAQGFGGVNNARMAGSLADIATTSFFPAKPLGCYGDGGAIFTDDHNLADVLCSIRAHGKGSDKYDNVRIGVNGRLDTIQAAVLLQKLDIFSDELKARSQVAETYSMHFSELGSQCLTPYLPKGYKSAWAQYSILLESQSQRNYLRHTLTQAGVPTAIYYPKPLHLQGAYRYLKYNEGELPLSENISTRILSLPMHPYLEIKAIEKIIKIVRSVFNK